MARIYHLSAAVWKEGRRYVSNCPELGVASFGNAPSGALGALKEAVSLYLRNARRLGLMKDLEPVLASGERLMASLHVVA